jgi:hypothetical protein
MRSVGYSLQQNGLTYYVWKRHLICISTVNNNQNSITNYFCLSIHYMLAFITDKNIRIVSNCCWHLFGVSWLLHCFLFWCLCGCHSFRYYISNQCKRMREQKGITSYFFSTLIGKGKAFTKVTMSDLWNWVTWTLLTIM